VAEHAVALLLALTRQIVPLNQSIKAGAWTERPQELATRRSKMLRVAGSTVGIVGLGNIGRAFAVRIKGFGPARILAVDPYIEQTTADIYGVQLVDLDTLLRESDFVTVHAPDTPETHHLIGLPELEKMKRNACLVNTARGPLVDNEALCEGLSRGYIAGAALDVTEPEPIGADNPLTRMDNVILTPHYAGYSDVSRRFGFRAWPENVAFVLEGKPPYGLANPDVIGRIAVIRAQGPSKWDNVP